MNSNIKRSLFYNLIFFFGKILNFFFYDTCTRHKKYRLLLVLLTGLPTWACVERNTLLFVLLFDMRNLESIIYSDFVFVSALIWYSIYYNTLWGQVWSCIQWSVYCVILTLIRNAFTTCSILWFFFCKKKEMHTIFLYFVLSTPLKF